MTENPQKKDVPKQRSRALTGLVIGGISFAAWRYLGYPAVMAGPVIEPLPLLTAAGMAIGVSMVAPKSLKVLANFCVQAKAKIPSGVKGRARLVKSVRELKHELVADTVPAPWWGTMNGKAVRSLIEACACVVGSSGSGKSTCSYITTILSLLGENIIFFDFKSDVTVQIVPAIHDSNSILITINLGGLHTDLVGETDYYNPLIIIAELFYTQRGLEVLVDTVRQLCLRLEPDRDAENEGTFWTKSNRRWGGIVIQLVVLLKGPDGTLGDVLQMLNDREALLQNARFFAGRLEARRKDGTTECSGPRFHDLEWAASGCHDRIDIENYAEFLRGLASSLCDNLEASDSRLADNVLAGSQEMLSGFEITTRAHKITSKTTFRFSSLKDDADQNIVLSYMFNPDLGAAQAKVVSILNFCQDWELKRHPNKHKRVWNLIDEATNIPLVKVDEMITWSRSYSVIPIFWFQNFARWEKAFGKTALEVLISEAEIILIMPSTRNLTTLEMTSKMVGEESVVLPHYRANDKLGTFGTELSDYREESNALIDPFTLRTMDQGVLRIRKNPCALVDLPSVAEIHPWRTKIAGSPMYGFKPYLKPIKHYLGWTRWLRRLGFASAAMNGAIAIITLSAFLLTQGGN